MKTALLLLTMVILSKISYSQIGYTLSEVKSTWGYNYTEDYTNGNEDEKKYYIYYQEETETQNSGRYTKLRVIYFTANKSDAVCVMWALVEPISEINANIKFFESKMVKVGDLLWKDYATNLLYQIINKDETCVIKCVYDNQ